VKNNNKTTIKPFEDKNIRTSWNNKEENNQLKIIEKIKWSKKNDFKK
jgi:hypothetical protein